MEHVRRAKQAQPLRASLNGEKQNTLLCLSKLPRLLPQGGSLGPDARRADNPLDHDCLLNGDD